MSTKKHRTQVQINLIEEDIIIKQDVKSVSSHPTFHLKLKKSSIAPADYKAVYDQNIYPRSVFSSGKVQQEAATVKDSKKRLFGFFKNVFSDKSQKSDKKSTPPRVTFAADNLKVNGINKVEEKLDANDINKKENQSFVYRHSIANKIYKFGERDSGFETKGQPQDFYEIRDQCLANGTLFEDQEFPPNDRSLFYSQRPDRYIEWRRPNEIVDDPKLFVEGFSRFDVQQGELGDCWLLAAVANLTLYKRLFFQVVPDDQNFDDDYAGIFHFRFWQYGRWVDVVIDDRLPTYRGELLYLHSAEKNEFWSALLEKAYAKLHGSYEALKGGSTCEAMEDFTGGVTEMYELQTPPPDLFQIVLKAFERASLMGCSLEPDPNVLEAQTSEGLIRGHAYSITKVQYADIETPNTRGKIPLLRLRNPWGNESEWNGPWSDHSPEWQFISDDEKEKLGITFDNDGEFWMSFKDFQKYFDRLEICNLNPDSLSEEEAAEGHKKRWEMSVFEGEWARGLSAGGCRNFLDTFPQNPQYRVTLTDPDDEDAEETCTIIIGLMQKDRRQQRQHGGDLLTIGFAIYYLPYPDRVPKPLDVYFFKHNASVARSPSFINLREVSCRFKLPPGTYCIVPSTFDPNEEGRFLLRIFSEHKNNMETNDIDVGIDQLDGKKMKEHLPPTANEMKAEEAAMETFMKIAGPDREVDWLELQQVLNVFAEKELNGKEFSKSTCRTLIAIRDKDRSGKLNFQEMTRFWFELINLMHIWKKFDNDFTGTLNGCELKTSLASAGYRLNNNILIMIMHRYANKDGCIDFDDFVLISQRLNYITEQYKLKKPNESGKIQFDLLEFLEVSLDS